MKKLLLLISMLPLMAFAESRIPISMSKTQTYTNTNNRKLNGISITTPSNGTQVLSADPSRVYNDLTDKRLYAKPGEAINVSFNYQGTWMNGYVYIDRNSDDELIPLLGDNGVPTDDSELLSHSFYSGNDNNDASGHNSNGQELTGGARSTLQVPAFTLPADLEEGEYTIRFKVDWNSIDPAGDTNPSNGTFMSNGGAIVDATLFVTYQSVPKAPRMHFKSNYGFFVGAGSETGLPDLVPQNSLRVKLVAPSSCYKLPQTVKVVTRSTDPEGEDTEMDCAVASGIFEIPASMMGGGDVYVTAEFSEPTSFAATDYQLTFSDEFDGPDKSQPDATRWKRADHNNNSTWNRFVSTSDKVVYIEYGELVTRCIPCAEEDRESNKNPISPFNYRDWMSGAVDTKGLYSFKYGRIDVRALTNPFSGSFPAIWLLPDDQSAGWPYYGEIDIWEMVNTNNTAFGTVHAQRESQNSGNTACNYDGLYHVYTLEWNSGMMRWSIDGKTAYVTYRKNQLTSDQIASGWWPFDKNFYLILNQSVGSGGWAANPVDGHIYETRFDFVRIYQSENLNPILGVTPPHIASTPHSTMIHDLWGNAYDQMPNDKGVFIINGKKVRR